MHKIKMENAIKTTIARIEKKQFSQFHGGVHPPEQKFITNGKPIRPLALPEKLIIPIQQHIGQSGKLLVKAGDHVLKGQALTYANMPMAVSVHAPTSGTISTIEQATIAHPSAMQDICISLIPDGNDTWRPRHICDDFYQLSREDIINKIADAGIAGMGGAGFPTHYKVNTKPAINYLIINAAECEPYITADDLLIREHSPSIIDGVKILNHLLLPEYILIAIEDNKPEAIKALQNATKDIEKVKVCVVPTKYPTGGEKQLIQVLTGQEIPSGVYPGQLGIIMQNVATCFAIADAVINDIPLIRRVVTVTGQALDKPQNVWAYLGTPVSFLLTQCGYQSQNNHHLIMGGPMMGFSLPNPAVPVVKTTNCILAPTTKEIPKESQEVECIRCGQCADVCPSQLLPQELQWSAKAKDYPQLDKLNLFDCIECGACAYVCPSQIPLVQYYRVAKAEVRHLKEQEIKAEKAKARFEARKTRLEQEKVAREEKHRKAAEVRRQKMNAATPEAENAKSAVAAALARVKAKKMGTTATSSSSENTATNAATEIADNQNAQKSQVAAAIARAKAKKLAAQQAKVSKEAQQPNEQQAQSDSNTPREQVEAENKKAKIAATIAKAKAKKLASQTSQNTENKTASVVRTSPEHVTKPATESHSEETTAIVDKKAKIAAAVAKAKAKKLALQQNQSANTENAAIEKNTAPSVQNETIALSPEEEKKKRIAAAIAKAKAKKQQQLES